MERQSPPTESLRATPTQTTRIAAWPRLQELTINPILTNFRSQSFAACEVARLNGRRYDWIMDAPDIYQDAALADITLICQQCKASLDSENLPEGQPRF